MSTTAVIVAKEPGRHAIQSGHPWLRSNSLQIPSAPIEDGSEVDVVDRDGTWLARGFYNSNSFLKVRIYSRKPGQLLDDDFWRSRIQAALKLRRDLGLIKPTGACRLIFSESDQLSGLIIDQYAGHFVMSLTAKATQIRWKSIAKLFHECFTDFPIQALIVKTDANMVANEKMESTDAVEFGEFPSQPIEIIENDLKFQVSFSEGQKTGFYLDQQFNRKLFSELAFGKILDICCYSGGFSLSAAKGGRSTSITAVDSSMSALEQAEIHAKINGFEDIDFVKADCFDYLTHLKSAGTKFDSIVLDPPKFAGRRQDARVAMNAYYRLNRLALDLINPGGLLLTCSCSGRVLPDEFVQAVTSAGRRTGRELQLLHQTGASPDHPVLLSCPETQYLKCLVIRVH